MLHIELWGDWGRMSFISYHLFMSNYLFISVLLWCFSMFVFEAINNMNQQYNFNEVFSKEKIADTGLDYGSLSVGPFLANCMIILIEWKWLNHLQIEFSFANFQVFLHPVHDTDLLKIRNFCLLFENFSLFNYSAFFLLFIL